MTDPTRDPGLDLHRGPAGEPTANSTDTGRRGTVPPPPVGRGEVRHGRAVGWRSRDVVRAAALVLAMYLVLQLVWFANALFLTIFLGVLFAIAVSAGVDKLQRWRVPRGVGAALIVLAFFAVLIGVGAVVAPVLRSQGAELRVKLPEAVDRVEAWINRRESGMVGMLLGGSEAAPDSLLANRPAPAGARPDSARPDSTVAPPTLRGRFQRQFQGMSRYLFPFARSTVAAVGGFLLVVFLSIYLAADPDLYRRGVLALLPARRRETAAQIMDRIATVLRKWLVTQLIAMAVIGSASTVALLVLGVKAAFALGLLAGLFEFMPTVGPLLSAIPAIGMGFLDSPEKAALVALVYTVIHFSESHVLIPLLMKGGMNLPPALTVVAQALLALVFGFLGLMVAVPMVATVMVIVQALYVEQLPLRGTWTHRARAPGLGEPDDAAGAHA
jgi:predicted PurR-regulated permease PerM